MHRGDVGFTCVLVWVVLGRHELGRVSPLAPSVVSSARQSRGFVVDGLIRSFPWLRLQD